jgi:excisionase family DNA binding protein
MTRLELADLKANDTRASFTVELDLEALAERVASLILERLDHEPASPWLDSPAAATYLCCSIERVRKLVSRREIPFHQAQTGGRVFFHRRELDEWLLRQ